MDESCRQSLRAAAAAAAAARAAGASSCMRPRTPLRLCLALALLMLKVVAQAAEVSLCLSPSTLCCMHLPVVVFPAEAVDESPVLDHTKLPACLIGKQHVSRISRTPLHQQEGTGEELVFVEPAYAVPADNYTAVRWRRVFWAAMQLRPPAGCPLSNIPAVGLPSLLRSPKPGAPALYTATPVTPPACPAWCQQEVMVRLPKNTTSSFNCPGYPYSQIVEISSSGEAGRMTRLS